MKTCEHQDSECDCQKCDSFTCFEKRQKPSSCECPECKNSQTCIFYSDKDKDNKIEQPCTLASKGCNTKEVWNKTDKYHLGRDIVCSNCEPNKKSRRSSKECNHGKLKEMCEDDSLKSDDKLCSQCEFKRNVLRCLNEGSDIKGLTASVDSSQDKVLCNKCERERSNSDTYKNNADAEHVCKKYDRTIHDVEGLERNNYKKFNSIDSNIDTIIKNNSDSIKDKSCSKCLMKEESNKKFKKYSFDDGKVYEFPDDENPEATQYNGKDSTSGHGKMCNKCQFKKNAQQKLKKFSFDNGKVYEFDGGKSCGTSNRPQSDVCSKCQMNKAAQQKAKPVCATRTPQESDSQKKDCKHIKVCTKCGRSKSSDPNSMKIMYTDKNGNDVVCNKLIKTITKTEKDKVYKFKDAAGTKIVKKISSREFKKSLERHFGKATQVNSISCPAQKPNKDAKRHLSCQVMNAPSAKALKPCKCSSATQANKAQQAIPKFDIFKRIKQIYDACSCKECQCIASNPLTTCNSHSIKGKSDSKYAQNLQFWEGFRAALNNLLHEKPACKCKNCECVACIDGKAKTCSCKTCHCIECASVMKNQTKQNTIVVAAVGENAQNSNCACAPCDCIRCRTNVVSMSSNATHEISTGQTRHPNCHCQNCINDDCVPDNSEVCKCKRKSETIKKPVSPDANSYDVRIAQVHYDRSKKKPRYETIAMFVKVPKIFPFQNQSFQSVYKESECSCKIGKAEANEDMRYIEINNSPQSSCSCVTCNCEACTEANKKLDETSNTVNYASSRCDCKDCDCDACRGLNLDTEDICPQKIIRLQINDDVSCNCDLCEKMLLNKTSIDEDHTKIERYVCLHTHPSQSETINSNRSQSTKSINCQILDNTSSDISIYLPAATDDTDILHEASQKSDPSYEIASNDFKTSETDYKDFATYKHSFYEEIFEADYNLLNTYSRKLCKDSEGNGDCILNLPTKQASNTTFTQSPADENKSIETTNTAATTIKSIVNKIRSFTNAERLLTIARDFSADLMKILQKYENANRELSEKSHSYVTNLLDEKKDQLITRVNQYNFISARSKDKIDIPERDRDIWVIDGCCSKSGNIVYIPIKSNDDIQKETNRQATKYQREATEVNYVTTPDIVHINLRLRESAQSKSENKADIENERCVNKFKPALDKSAASLQSEVVKSKTTKMDLELRDVSNTRISREVSRTDSYKSYKYSKGDSNIKSLENTISFYNDFKVGAIEVQRVSTCSVIIKWSSPKVDTNVLGYELLIDGRPAQKILNPSRCMAFVSSLPKTDKVLLTVKTIMVTPSQIKYYPTMNSVYYPIL